MALVEKVRNFGLVDYDQRIADEHRGMVEVSYPKGLVGERVNGRMWTWKPKVFTHGNSVSESTYSRISGDILD